METELKLSFPDTESMYSVLSAPWFLDVLEIKGEKTEDYENRYLDTKDRILESSRTSMRIRHIVGEDYIHTVKTSPVSLANVLPESVRSGMTSRCEWNVSTDRKDFDVDYFLHEAKALEDPYEVLAAALVPVLGHELISVCKTAFRRHTVTAVFEGSTMEICLDNGECIASGKSLPILEMEIELISGDIEAVQKLGKLIMEHTGCSPLSISKYARCLMLMKEAQND